MIMSSLTKDVNRSIQLTKALIEDRDVPDSSSTDVPEKHIQKAYADKTVQEVLSSTRQRRAIDESNKAENARQEERLSAVKRTDLLQIHDMPKYLQFNPHILTGYRQMLSTKESIKSLFYLHNETVNILSHGIPIVYILWTVPSLIPWETVHTRFLPLCHIAGSVCPWVGSFIYHLFMNHAQGGERLYHKLLQLDMLGIWVTQSFGALPMVFSTSFCYPPSIRCLVISFYCLISIWGLYKALTAWSPWERRLCFALPFVMRLCLTLLRVTGFGGGDPSALASVFLQDFVSLIGGIIGAIHIPEKWFPGHFDLCFNSHNIMHILVVLAVYFMHNATMADLKWMASVDCANDVR